MTWLKLLLDYTQMKKTVVNIVKSKKVDMLAVGSMEYVGHSEIQDPDTQGAYMESPDSSLLFVTCHTDNL